MSGRLALKSALAFCLALGLGRLLLPNAPAPRASKQAAAGAPSDIPTVNVVAETQGAKGSLARSTVAPPRVAVDRELKAVDGGMRNENVNMAHRISNQYTEGTLHTAPQVRGSTVRWTPLAQELYRGGQVVAAAKAEPSRAAVEQASGHNRVLFPGTYSDTDERMYVRRDGGVEHDIILKRPVPGIDDSYGVAYSGRLQLSPGYSLWDGDHQITGPYSTKREVLIKDFYVDKDKGLQPGKAVFCLRPPVAWDASVALPGGSGMDEEMQSVKPGAATACEYRFDFNDDSSVKLSVVTPGRWLVDEERVYPVTIDPNLGPFGLADGSPPIYIGTAGNDTLIPVNAGGTVLVPTVTCPGKPDDGYGTIIVPFAFEYYGIIYPANSPLYVHIDGFASYDQPAANQECFDPNNMPIPTPGYPDNAFFAYWSDMRFSTQQGAGIYWYIDGTAPSRRLVIEWFAMSFVNVPGNDIISFNLIMYECDNKIAFVIGQAGDTDPGFCSVGIEDPTGAIGIQYDFNSAVNGAVLGNNNQNNNFFNNPFNPFGGFGGGFGGGFFGNGGGVGNPVGGGAGGGGNAAGGGAGAGNTTIGPISPGTSVMFQRAAIGFVVSTPNGPLDGCIPHTVCWSTQVTVPVSTCSNGETFPPSFGFQWDFGDTGGAYTKDACHTWVRPGTYNVALKVSDQNGTSTTRNFVVKVCDVPEVSILANPQGGTVPVTVNLQAYAASPTTQLAATPFWTIDRMGVENNPGQFLTVGALSGNPVSVLFTSQGLFRITATYTGTDTASGLNTTGVGTVYIYVASPTQKIVDSLLITESKFTIDWTGKYAKPSTSKIAPLGGGAASNPENDTLSVSGFISLPGVQVSDLLGKRVQVILNGADAILDATFGADGKAIQPAQDNGRTGEFDISLPSGAFTCHVKRSLFWQLGVSDGNKNFLLPAFFRIQIENLYPPVGVPGGLITYSYNAKGFNAGPPPSGKGTGAFKLGASAPGRFATGVPVPADFGNPGGQEVLLSGAFMVLSAKIKLLGNSVFADLRGKLARYGGDSLRPQDSSNVIVSLGAWSEALGFSTTAGFKASGKVPRQRFSFKRSKSLGQTGVASLQWANKAGDFRIQTFALPNELVGLNPGLGVQALTAGLTITPDGGQVYDGKSTFQVTKTSATDFVKNGK